MRCKSMLWTVGTASIQNWVLRKTHKVLIIDYCKVRVITPSAMDTSDNV